MLLILVMTGVVWEAVVGFSVDPPKTTATDRQHLQRSLTEPTSKSDLVARPPLPFSEKSLLARRGVVFSTVCESDPVVKSGSLSSVGDSAAPSMSPSERARLRYQACFYGGSSKSTGRYVEQISTGEGGSEIKAGAGDSKFMYFGNKWGRHSNQLTSMVGALALARALGRTLIMPPFAIEKAKGSKGSQSATTIDIFDIYNTQNLFDVTKSPFCVLTEEEFYALERERKDKRHAHVLKKHVRELQGKDRNAFVDGTPLYYPARKKSKGPLTTAALATEEDERHVALDNDTNADGLLSGNAREDDVVLVPTACVTMRGIKLTQQPPRMQFQCSKDSTVTIKYKKDLQLFMERLLPSSPEAQKASPRVISIPLVIYYTPKIPLPCILCVWRFIKPHPLVKTALETLWVDLGGGSPLASTGVHLRSLEGSCQGRIEEGERAFKRQIAEQTDDGARKSKVQAIGGHPVVHGVRLFPLRPDGDGDPLHAAWQSAGFFGYVGDGWGEAKTTAEGKEAWKSALTRQCAIDTESIRSLSPSKSYVFLADDGQQPQYVNMLAKTFTRSKRVGELLTNPASKFQQFITSIIHSTSDEFPSLDPSNTLRAPNSDAALVPVTNPGSTVRNRFRAAASTFLTQIDFWLLARCDVFVGNQLSTLSLNVCRQRMSEGKRCENFTPIQY